VLNVKVLDEFQQSDVYLEYFSSSSKRLRSCAVQMVQNLTTTKRQNKKSAHLA